MRVWTLLLFSLVSVLALAQDGRWVNIRMAHGYVLPHRVIVDHLIQGPSSTYSLEYAVGTNGSRDWHHHYNRPQKGIGAYYKRTGATEELGELYSIYPFLRLPLLAKGEHHQLVFDVSAGVVYSSETYDYQDNAQSTAIGSHWNYGAIMGIKHQWAQGPFMLRTGISISHASNAALELPNLGINVLSIDASLAYRIARADSWSREERSVGEQRPYWSFGLTTGVRAIDPVLGGKHGIQEIRLIRQFRTSDKISWIYGADLIHNRATYIRDTDSPRVYRMFQMGVNAGLRIHFGDKDLFFQQGVYLAQGKQEQGAFYNRVGGRKTLGDRYYVSLGLKTHFAKADYLFVGIGTHWKN